MSAKIITLGLAAAALFGATGCKTAYVTKWTYERDVNQLKEYIGALERDNGDMRKFKEAYERLKTDADLVAEANRAYDEMADSLKKALAGLGADQAFFDRSRGAFVFSEELLFDSGSFTISAKGREVLKKFADAQKGAGLKIVGHTDPVKVARASTKAALFSDTNIELSALRAVAVAWELQKSGVPESRLWVEGRGSTEPRAGGNKASRRVEIYIVKAGAKTSSK